MTDETIDPIRDHMPAGASESDLREYGTALVRNGMDAESVNVSLVARGAKPLDTGSAEFAATIRDAKLADPKFQEAILSGDAAALMEISLLEMHAQRNAGSKLAESADSAEDYATTVEAALVSHNPYFCAETAAGYAKNMTELAAALQLDPAYTKSLTEIHLDNFAARAGLSSDDNALYSQQQEADFGAAIGDEKKITDANAILSKMRGGKAFDLKEVARLDGAMAALSLLNHATSRRV